PATTCAMRSMQARRGANLAGNRVWSSNAAWSRQYAGIWKIQHGGNHLAGTFIGASALGSWQAALNVHEADSRCGQVGAGSPLPRGIGNPAPDPIGCDGAPGT